MEHRHENKNVDVEHADKACLPPPTKRIKKASADSAAADSAVGSSSLNLDALTVVMLFVNPRQLLRLSRTCRTLRDAITTELVVKSAMIYGGHSRKTLEELYPLYSKRSIYVPTPTRLLALSNGKRCEHCHTAKVYFVRPHYGLFLCWGCLTSNYTSGWKYGGKKRMEKYGPILEHDRTAGSEYSSTMYLMTKHFLCNQTTTATCNSNNNDNNQQETTTKNGPIVRINDIYNIADHEPKEGNNYDDYLESILNAPTKEEYQEFIDAYEGCKERARKVEMERYEKKMESSKNSKNKKKEKALKIANDLKDALNESWRDGAAMFVEVYPSKRNGPIEFRSPYVESLLKPYVLSPSKFRKKLLKEIVEKIDEKFALIVETKFLSFDFLPKEEESLSSSSSSFVHKLEERISKEFPSIEVLVSKKYSKINETWFDLLKNNQLFDALADLYGGNFGCLLLTESDYNDDGNNNGYYYVNKRKKKTNNKLVLAEFVYKSELRKCNSSTDGGDGDYYYHICRMKTPPSIREHSKAFDDSVQVYETVKNNIDKYSVWLDEKYDKKDVEVGSRHLEDKERPGWANKNVYSSIHENLPFLLSEDYEGLDKNQKSSFDDYMWNNFYR